MPVMTCQVTTDGLVIYQKNTLKTLTVMQRLHRDLFTAEQPNIFVPFNDIEQNVEYRFNISQTSIEREDLVTEGFKYDALIVPYPLNANNVMKTMLTELYPESVEQKLQNDYSAADLGIESIEKKQAYIDYLNIRKSLRLMIDADCIANNIPLQ